MIYIPQELLQQANTGSHLHLLCTRAKINPCPSGRTCRRVFAAYRRRNPPVVYTPPSSVQRIASPDQYRLCLSGSKFVFTSAQNDTDVHTDFLNTLLNYCNVNNAELIIGASTYNTVQEFHESVRPYLLLESARITDGLVWCGELNISPTAVNPLSSLDSYCVGNSGIIPHTKVQLKSLPHLPGDAVNMQYTTGTCTLRNYIQAKEGHKASFHHIYGALVVEIDADGDWFIRQLIADSSGGFHDLDVYYRPDGTHEKGKTVRAITWGDVHFPNQSEDFFPVVASVSSVLKPDFHFLHDVYDFMIRNHHNRNDAHFNILHANKKVHDEFDKMSVYLEHFADLVDDASVVVVHSNHDAALDRWLKETDFREDPVNAPFFLWCQYTLHRNTDFCEGRLKAYLPLLFKQWVTDLGLEYNRRVQFLEPDESFELFSDTSKPIECGIHGHLGINGSIGHPKQFTKIGKRVNTAHTHSAGIFDGVYTAGTSTPLDMGYNRGPSTWNQSHIITYPNSKRTIITQRGKKWRA